MDEEQKNLEILKTGMEVLIDEFQKKTFLFIEKNIGSKYGKQAMFSSFETMSKFCLLQVLNFLKDDPVKQFEILNRHLNYILNEMNKLKEKGE